MPRENSVSAKRDTIHDFLHKYAGGKYADAGVERDYESGDFLLVLPPSASNATDRAIAMLEGRLLRDLKVSVTVNRLVGESDEAVANILLKALAKSLSEGLADVVIAIDNQQCDVIIVVRSATDLPDDADRKKVHRKIDKILEAVDLEVGTVLFALLGGDSPSEYQLIRHISTLSPVSVERLAQSLQKDDLHVPSTRWLNRQLDELSRRKLVKFQADGGFVLTETGLSVLPRLEHRNSPDVQRALALARRRWIH